MEKEKAVVSEMLNNYYSQTYRHCERNKGFIEVSTVAGERMFVSVHHIAYVKATKIGLGVIVDRNGKSITTDKPFIELAMECELATKRVADRKPEQPEPIPPQRRRQNERR